MIDKTGQVRAYGLSYMRDDYTIFLYLRRIGVFVYR